MTEPVRAVFGATALVLGVTPALAAADTAPTMLRHCLDCPDMIAIPAGDFVIGTTEAETTREGVPDNQAALEHPQRAIAVPAFAIGVTEVTVAQYRVFAEETGRAATECQVFVKDDAFVGWVTLHGSGWNDPGFRQEDDHPVACVTEQDADAYAAWLVERTGQPYRLPSEAEWEYAARAGTTTARYWGDGVERACDYASVSGAENYRQQFACSDGYTHTAPAGYGIANGFGLYGMLGNIGEWTADCALTNYAGIPTDGSPWREGECIDRIGRGGSWWNDPYYIRAGRRFFTHGAYYIMGFRVAMDLDLPPLLEIARPSDPRITSP